MTEIITEKKEVAYPADQVFQFLSNFNHFKNLLPEDKVEDWQSTEESCSFRIKGMTNLGLKLGETQKPSKIVMLSDGKVPFKFELSVFIEALDDNKSLAHIEFEGDINSFMTMMVEKPLTNFFNMLVDKLSKLELEKFL